MSKNFSILLMTGLWLWVPCAVAQTKVSEILESSSALTPQSQDTTQPGSLSSSTPVTTEQPFVFIPADRSCCTRPEDGVGLADGSIVVGDRDSGLRFISRNHGSSRPFGAIPADALVNGISLDRHGLLIVTDIAKARVFEVNPLTEETRTLFTGPESAVLNDAVRNRHGVIWVSLSTSSPLLDAILVPLPDGAIWQINPTSDSGQGTFSYEGAEALVVADRLMFANGLLLDNDESHLYWAETTGNLIMKATISSEDELEDSTVFAQIPFGADNLAMDVRGNVYFASDWLTGVWAINPSGSVFAILDFRWARTPLLIRAWADSTASADDRLALIEPNKRPPQFPRVPSTPFFVKDGQWLCLGTYETDLQPDRFNRLPCMPAPIRGEMR